MRGFCLMNDQYYPVPSVDIVVTDRYYLVLFVGRLAMRIDLPSKMVRRSAVRWEREQYYPFFSDVLYLSNELYYVNYFHVCVACMQTGSTHSPNQLGCFCGCQEVGASTWYRGLHCLTRRQMRLERMLYASQDQLKALTCSPLLVHLS